MIGSPFGVLEKRGMALTVGVGVDGAFATALPSLIDHMPILKGLMSHFDGTKVPSKTRCWRGGWRPLVSVFTSAETAASKADTCPGAGPVPGGRTYLQACTDRSRVYRSIQ